MSRAFADLHCHSRGSFDSLVRASGHGQGGHRRGLTHLAITDHDRIDVALEARELAPAELTVIVGEEVKTLEGDLICLFLERAIPPGLSGRSSRSRAARDQGALGRDPASVRLAAWVPAARRGAWQSLVPHDRLGRDAQRSAGRSWQRGCPGVRARAWPAGDLGLGRAFGDGGRGRLHRVRWQPVDARPACSRRLPSAEIIPGRASYLVRLWTPVAKGVNHVRGNRRVAAGPPADRRGPTGPPIVSEPGGQDHRPVVDEAVRSGRVRCDGGHTHHSTPRSRITTPIRSSKRSRTSRPRSRRSRSASGCASRGRSCRSSSRSGSSPSSCTSTASGWPQVPQLILQANPALVLSPSSSSTSASRCAATAGSGSCARRGSSSACATRSRSCTSRGSSIASCRPSSATSIAPTCSR